MRERREGDWGIKSLGPAWWEKKRHVEQYLLDSTCVCDCLMASEHCSQNEDNLHSWLSLDKVPGDPLVFGVFKVQHLLILIVFTEKLAGLFFKKTSSHLAKLFI